MVSVSAEKILKLRNKRYIPLVDKVKASTEWAALSEREKKGAVQLLPADNALSTYNKEAFEQAYQKLPEDVKSQLSR